MKTGKVTGWATGVVVLAALTAARGDRYWDAGGGTDRNWETPANWNGDVLPTPADNVYIGQVSYTRSATATLSTAIGCFSLNLGASANTKGILEMPSGYVANGGSLSVGTAAGGTGYFLLTGGVVSNYNITEIGSSGNGRFRNEGGQLISRRYTQIGTSTGSRGRLEQTDGLTLSGLGFFIGALGHGEVWLGGGTLVTPSVEIGRNGTTPVTGRVEVAGGVWSNATTLWIGAYAGCVGSITQRAGVVRVGSDLLVGRSGPGAYTLGGGTCRVVNAMTVGNAGSYLSDLKLEGGLLTTKTLTVGANAGAGGGRVEQSGGRVTLADEFVIGKSGRGEYVMSGGVIDFAPLSWKFTVSQYARAVGVFRQTGGVLHAPPTTSVAGTPTSTGLWSVVNGAVLDLGASSFVCAQQGQGELRLGDVASIGLVTGIVGSVLTVTHPESASARGTLSGCGTVKVAKLYSLGALRADGYGTSRALDLTEAGLQLNSSAYFPPRNGCWAVNGGKLRMKVIDPGNGWYYWGTYRDVANYVNSLRVQMSGGSPAGLPGELLASDCADVHPGLYRPLGIWDFGGFNAYSSATIEIHYDSASPNFDGDVAQFRLYRWNGAGWEQLDATLDPDTDMIVATNVTGPLTQLAVARPTAGTVISIR